MSKMKLFIIAESLILVEAIILVLFHWTFDCHFTEKNECLPAIASLSLFLMVVSYKTIFEVWLFMLTIHFRCRDKSLHINDLIWGKALSSIPIMLILIGAALDSPELYDLFTLLCIIYLPSVIFSFLLLKQYWVKLIKWVNNV